MYVAWQVLAVESWAGWNVPELASAVEINQSPGRERCSETSSQPNWYFWKPPYFWIFYQNYTASYFSLKKKGKRMNCNHCKYCPTSFNIPTMPAVNLPACRRETSCKKQCSLQLRYGNMTWYFTSDSPHLSHVTAPVLYYLREKDRVMVKKEKKIYCRILHTPKLDTCHNCSL